MAGPVRLKLTGLYRVTRYGTVFTNRPFVAEQLHWGLTGLLSFAPTTHDFSFAR